MLKKICYIFSCASALAISGNAVAIGSELILPQGESVNHTNSTAASLRLKALSQERFFKSASVVKIDPNAFLSNIVKITFKNYRFTFLKNGGEVADSKNWTWTGKADTGIGDAIVTSSQGILVGSFHYHGLLLRLNETADNEYYLEELDETITKPTGDDGVGVEEGQRRAAELLSSPKKKLIEVTSAATTNPVVSILVAFGPAAVSYFGSQSNLLLNINTEITDLNSILRNSGVNLTTRLAGTVAVNYTGPRDAASTLAAFQVMPEVKSARDASNADVMIYIGSLSDFCGRANIFPAPGAAYGIVDDACMTTQHTFAHEFGHLLGAGHDTYNSSPNGAQPYAHGAELWRFKNSSADYTKEYFWCAHTVMSYAFDIEDPNPAGPCFSDQLLPLFSSPLITTQMNYGSVPTIITTAVGSSNIDNARMLNETASTVANNHNTRISGGIVAYRMILAPSTMNLIIGQSGLFSFNSYDSGGAVVGNPPGSTAVWTSSNPAVATISGGRVTAISAGSAQITLSDALVSNPTVTAIVSVTSQVLSALTTTPSSLAINVSQSQTIVLTGYDQNGASMPLVGITTWTSANPSVASVDSTGRVLGISVGTTTITGANGGRSITSSVSVSAKPGINPPTCGRSCSGAIPAPVPSLMPNP